MTKGLLTTFPTFSSQYLNIVSMSNTSTKILIETSKGLLSLKQISEISGIELPIIRNRYYRGKRGDELFAPKTNAPVMLEYNGKPLPISEVSEITGISIQALYQRYKKKGLSGDALYAPQKILHEPEYYIGKKFGRLTVLSILDTKENRRYRCTCICECGKEKEYSLHRVYSGLVQSCGCLKGQQSITHNMSKTKEHKAWRHIKERCLNKSCHAYAKYGGRGIEICERWKHSFENFYKDMGPAPSPKHTVDRINVNGNYEPTNCRWATRTQQNRNRTNTAYATYRGQTKSLPEWAALLGVSSDRLRQAYNKGADMTKYFDNIRIGKLKRIPY